MDRFTPDGRLGGKLVRLDEHPRLLLRGATLIDGAGQVVPDAILAIVDQRVVAAGPADRVSLPAESDFESWDLAGLTVLPGLIDAHLHFTGSRSFNVYQRYAIENETYHSFLAALDAYRTFEAGFTTVRHLGHGPSERSYALKQAINEGTLLGPRILTSGWAFSQSGGHGNVHQFPREWVYDRWPRSGFADGVEGCRKAVRLNFGEGADLVKIYTSEGGHARASRVGLSNYTLPEVDAMADEAHRRGAKIAAHAAYPESIRIAVLGGIDTIEHGDGLVDAPELVQLMIDRGVILVPTMTAYYRLWTEGERYGASPVLVSRGKGVIERHRRFLLEAYRMGLRVAVGTDTGNTFGLGDNALELQLLVEAGLTPMQAIVAATKVGAEALGLEAQLGVLEAGKLAELLVLERNPLEDIGLLRDKQNIRWIFKSSHALA